MRPLFSVCLLLCACGVDRGYLVRYASEALSCDRRLEIEAISHTAYEVTGCNRRALFECPERERCERLTEVFELSRR